MGMAEVGSWHGGAENCTPPGPPLSAGPPDCPDLAHPAIGLDRYGTLELNGGRRRNKGGNPNWHRRMPSPSRGGRPKSIAEMVALATQNSVEAILKPLEVMRTAKNPATQLAVANAIGAETIDHEPAQDT